MVFTLSICLLMQTQPKYKCSRGACSQTFKTARCWKIPCLVIKAPYHSCQPSSSAGNGKVAANLRFQEYSSTGHIWFNNLGCASSEILNIGLGFLTLDPLIFLVSSPTFPYPWFAWASVQNFRFLEKLSSSSVASPIFSSLHNSKQEI